MSKPTNQYFAVVLFACALNAYAADPQRVTILYDAFGPASSLKKDWGYAALVEYGGVPQASSSSITSGGA